MTLCTVGINGERARAVLDVLRSARGRWMPSGEIAECIMYAEPDLLNVVGPTETVQTVLRHLEGEGLARRTRLGLRVDHWQSVEAAALQHFERSEEAQK